MLTNHGTFVSLAILVALAAPHGAGAVAAPASRPPRVVLLQPSDAVNAPPEVRAWVAVFASIGVPVVQRSPNARDLGSANVVVVPPRTARVLPAAQNSFLASFVERGGRLLTAGESGLATALGVRVEDDDLPVIGLADTLVPALEITWTTPVRMPRFAVPAGAKVLAWVRGTEQPAVVGFSRGAGRVLFLGTDISDGPVGYGRYPLLLAAARDALGLVPYLSRRALAVYCDPADRRGDDPDAVASGWAAWGVAEVHLGAWDFWEGAPGWVGALIDACHRRGIRVLAWLEFPEVSARFWQDHPEWRERTAGGRYAEVDWRKLMALEVPECFDAVAADLVALLDRHDWDGVDIAELYFESPLGPSAPDRFTPMHDHVREAFTGIAGFDPATLFDRASPRYWQRDAASLADFNAFRRDLIVDLHHRLLGVVARVRDRRPDLDLVVTTIDAFGDPTMRDAIAVDPERIAGAAANAGARLQIEDPFTLWTQGPDRYATIARAWAPLAPAGRPPSVDINVVPRPGEVYPTDQQTGLELLEQVAVAARNFQRICIYSENTVYEHDRQWLAHALAAPAAIELTGSRSITVTSPQGVELELPVEPARVTIEGRSWPGVRGSTVLVPRGRHRIGWRTGSPIPAALRLRELNATLLAAEEHLDSLLVRYLSSGPAYLKVSFRPRVARLDGAPYVPKVTATDREVVVRAPAGDHTLRLWR